MKNILVMMNLMKIKIKMTIQKSLEISCNEQLLWKDIRAYCMFQRENKHDNRNESKYMKQNLLPVNIVSAKQMRIRMRQIGMGMDIGARTYW